MQLFLEDKPIILRLLEDTYYSQIIPRLICQSLLADIKIIFPHFYSSGFDKESACIVRQ